MLTGNGLLERFDRESDRFKAGRTQPVEYRFASIERLEELRPEVEGTMLHPGVKAFAEKPDSPAALVLRLATGEAWKLRPDWRAGEGVIHFRLDGLWKDPFGR